MEQDTEAATAEWVSQQSAAAQGSEKRWFAVLDEHDGRKYKVFLKSADFPRLRAGKVRKTLAGVTGVDGTAFDFFNASGDILLDDMAGGTFGLVPECTLRMRRRQAQAKQSAGHSPGERPASAPLPVAVDVSNLTAEQRRMQEAWMQDQGPFFAAFRPPAVADESTPRPLPGASPTSPSPAAPPPAAAPVADDERERLLTALRHATQEVERLQRQGPSEAVCDVSAEECRLLALEAAGHVRSFESLRAALTAELDDTRQALRAADARAASAERAQETAVRALEALQPAMAARTGSDAEAQRWLAAEQELAALRMAVADSGKAAAALQAQLDAEQRRTQTLAADLEGIKGAVRVVVRMRPPLREGASVPSDNGADVKRDDTIVAVDGEAGAVTVSHPATGARTFEYYRALDGAATQQQVFDDDVAPLVEGVLSGRNACVIAYGQTGSGKTHTMTGAIGDAAAEGVIPRALRLLLSRSDSHAASGGLGLGITMVEMYNDALTDLLADSGAAPLQLRLCPGSSAAEPVGAATVWVRTEAEALAVLARGNAGRQVHATLQNAVSTRSHVIATVRVAASSDGAARESKLVFADLAGSERVGRSQAAGERLKEAQCINRSLSALGDVVHALTTPGTPHVPYRNSKLTALLQDTLGGDSRTVFVACVAPTTAGGPGFMPESNTQETLSTLQFAARARCVRNIAFTRVTTSTPRPSGSGSAGRSSQRRSVSAAAAVRRRST